MALNGSLSMPYARTITVTTGLSRCVNRTLDLNQTKHDLEHLYQSSISNITSNFFLNISISQFNCSNINDKYFQQIITFTQSVSIRIQILFASIYYDYIKAINYELNGFIINQESSFTFSSVTVNSSAKFDACSASDAAQEPICLSNLSHPICSLQPSRWNVSCSENITTSTISLLSSTTLNHSLEEITMASRLNSWQIGLVCSLSVAFVLLIILTVVYFIRRYTHSKKIALSHVNLYNDMQLKRKGKTPQNQIFQKTKTNLQPGKGKNTAISWIHDGSLTNTLPNQQHCTNIKQAELHNQVTFVDHAKVHDPGFSSNLSIKPVKPTSAPTSPSNRIASKIISTPPIPRPISRTSMNQLKAITDGLQEDKLNESDNISLNQHSLSNSKKPGTPVSRKFDNDSIGDESLHDEDAWMSILAVVNAELAVLDEQDRKY